jgi:hypothetical protein
MMDELFDIALFLPAVLEQVDQMMPAPTTVTRRQKAMELLTNSLALETQFQQWLARVNSASPPGQSPYWVEACADPDASIPFPGSIKFRDATTGLMFQYYWMTQILLHRCIDSLNAAIFQPVVDSYSDMWPGLPPHLQADTVQYQHQRELAASICQGLDSALDNTAQPDMLLGPMTVALDFYRNMNSASPDGLLEMMWLESFRSRLIAKGQYVANVLQSQKWTEIANF